MDLKALQADVLRISDLYAANHGIDRDRDWALLKLQEELGELTAEHLRLSGRARGAGDADVTTAKGLMQGLRAAVKHVMDKVKTKSHHDDVIAVIQQLGL